MRRLADYLEDEWQGTSAQDVRNGVNWLLKWKC